ncbi:mycothiol system anti-sigma-R factor [Haloactinopolyspora alba]|uniref:Mycothiol system anti-sigma-R factor n=1 Tax=Haloactinopolyspora alba TaxID=648780 RepID=A0A2P8EB05_9ACTN|nr:mycothiol system anti-sigma-R factor [Haloactinopolyspora alba]PSL06652.1 mycothiol system anti-sigma-R factor [Haloactinopolyspora alba]
MSCDDNDVDCTEVLDRVYDFLDQELDSRTLTYDEIKAHLEQCRPCMSTYDIERVIREALARSCGCEHAPDELKSRIRARIEQVRVQISQTP